MLEGLKDLAVEAAWSLMPTRRPHQPLSWALDPRWLRSASIAWPVRYQWPQNRKWVHTLRQGLSRLVRVAKRDLSQPYPGIVLIELAVESRSWTVAIDISDYPVVNESCVHQVDLYFKMQYRREGYPWDRVVPGGFVPGDGRIYRLLSRLRALAAEGEPVFDVYGRFGLEFASELRLDAIRRLSESRDFAYEGGTRIVRYSRFLREVAVAKVC